MEKDEELNWRTIFCGGVLRTDYVKAPKRMTNIQDKYYLQIIELCLANLGAIQGLLLILNSNKQKKNPLE